MYFAATMIDTIYDDPDICRQQVNYARSLGVNAIRWPLQQGFAEPKFQKYGEYINFVYWPLNKFDACRDIFVREGMSVFFVQMNPFGGYSGHRMNLFYDVKNYERNFDGFIDSWKYIVDRYKDDPVVAGFELINEPQVPKTVKIGKKTKAGIDVYLALMQQTALELRQLTDKIFLVPCPGTSPAGFKDMKPIRDPNTYYPFHYYEKTEITHQGPRGRKKYISSTSKIKKDLEPAMAFARKFKQAIVNTEFGCMKFHEENQAEWIDDVMDVFYEYGISSTYNGVHRERDNVWALTDLGKTVFNYNVYRFLKDKQ